MSDEQARYILREHGIPVADPPTLLDWLAGIVSALVDAIRVMLGVW